MTVFISCPVSKRDYLTPEVVARLEADYGPVSYVNDRFVYGDEIDDCRLPLNFESRIDHVARFYDSDRDYVLVGGDYVQLVLLVARIAQLHGRLQVLRWDKKAEGYLVVKIGNPEECSKLDQPAAAVLI